MKIKFAISVSVLSFILIITMFMISGCGCKHQYTSSITKEPTCAEEGETTYTCLECGDIYTESIAKSNEHQCTSKVTKEATCAEEGETTYTCSVCGYSYTELIAKSSEHKYTSKVTKKATCENGEKTYLCSICGKSYIEIINAKYDHKYSSSITTTATCTKEGILTNKCNVCGYTYTTAIPKSDEHKSSDWIIDKKATCSSEGTKHQVCTVCGKTLVAETIKKTAHIAGDWITDSEPTCLLNGSKHQICVECGANIQSVSIKATGHNYDEDGFCRLCGDGTKAIEIENERHQKQIKQINDTYEEKLAYDEVDYEIYIGVLSEYGAQNYSASYCSQQAAAYYEKLQSASTRLIYLQLDTSGANAVKIKNQQKEIDSLREKYVYYNSLIEPCNQRDKALKKIQDDRNMQQSLINYENQLHEENLNKINNKQKNN